MKNRFVPPSTKLIIKVKSQEETKTASGLILVTENKEDNPHACLKGVVEYAGIDSKYVKAGDVVEFEHCYSRPVQVDGVKYKAVLEENILGAYKEPPTVFIPTVPKGTIVVNSCGQEICPVKKDDGVKSRTITEVPNRKVEDYKDE